MDPFTDIASLSEGLTHRSTSSVELVAATLDRISEIDEHTNAFITIDADGALLASRQSDERRQRGEERGPLDGIPIAIKDNLDVAGLPATSGTPIRRERVPNTDAVLVTALRDAGAVIVGKTNMVEYAMGSTGVNEFFGDACNPWSLTHYTGGSSSGSAAAVAAGLVPAAIGSDTACSIRLPAHACGIVGHKPTFNRVSQSGATHCTPRLDHFGPMTRTVRDAATVLSAIQEPGWPAIQLDPARRFRIGVLGGEFTHEVDPDVGVLFSRAVERLTDLGHDLRDVDLGVDLAESDDHGNAFGTDFTDAYDIELEAHPDLLGPELRSWVEAYRAADPVTYAEALRYQAWVTDYVATAMSELDLLICPTARVPAGLRETAVAEPRSGRAFHCSLFDMTGQPSVSVPMGFTPDGLPAGLMISGLAGDDDAVLSAAVGYQDVTDWMSRRPPIR